MKKRLCLLMAMFCMMLAAPAAWATTITLVGTNYPDDISAVVNFNYTPTSVTEGQILIDITNTSDIASALTAFAFNAPGSVTGLSAFSGPDGWSGVYSPNDIDTPMQYGLFDLASLTGPNFNGGKVGPGIDMGQSASFELDVTGTNMDTLTTHSFLDILSDLGGKAGYPQNFALRLEGIGTEGDSDVAISPVPEPGTIILLGMGFLGLAVYSKRRKNETSGGIAI